MLSIGLCAQLACIWEATARKPGNVHRYRDFDDVSYLDFVTSAAAIAPALDGAIDRPVGETVLEAIRATRQVVRTNTNLGMVLLLAPLAAVPRERALAGGIDDVLRRLTVADACQVYQAIRLAQPGGLGTVPEQDVAQQPTQTLRQVMSLAADRDLVARQYANGFQQVFTLGVPALQRGLELTASLEGAIVMCHLQLLSQHADSLIIRKCGVALATEASRRAQAVLDRGWPNSATSHDSIADFDAWLRADGHVRNPGTTADLVTACLFSALREGLAPLPPKLPWSAGDSLNKMVQCED